MALQTANQFQLGTDFSRLGSGIQQGQQIANQFQIGQQNKAIGERNTTKFDQEQSTIRATVLNKLATSMKTVPAEQRQAFLQSQVPELAKFNIDGAVFAQESLDDASLDEAILSTQSFISQEAGSSAPAASQKAFAPVVDPNTGQLGVPTFNPTTGEAGFDVIENAPLQKTSEQKRLANINEKQEEAEIDISKTERKEIIKQKVARTSKIKTELSERNRGAARSQRMLSQALTLAQQASQGLSGAAKLQLSRLVPGIDATDEAGLDATLKQLALEQLQQFKGPTTDFEFGVTQSIAGALGQSKESNIARIKSLDRARYFNETEFKQFNQFTKDGGDPDNFRFNFQEIVKTKKGPFSLQDLQDTAVQNNLTIEETIKRLNE
jgi:hypothetical protein